MKLSSWFPSFFLMLPVFGFSAEAPAHTLPATYSQPINGLVYRDGNLNGKRDSEESGLEGIAVSDGKEIVLTDEQGAFQFANKEKLAKLVFVSVPSGYEKGGNFFQFLADGSETRFCEFGLRPSQALDSSEFSFIQLTDVHINGPGDLAQWKRELEEASLTEPSPAFLIVTGDLVGKGDDLEQMETYKAGLSASKVPVYNVCGNHDRCKGDDRAIAYNRFFGPDYYSFTEGDHHFVVLNNTVDNPHEMEWLKQDLKLLGNGKTVYAFQHYPPYEETAKELEALGIKYVFSGHWHSSKITKMGDLQCINTPSFSFGGIDLSPSGFRRVVLKGDEFQSEYRPNGVKDFFHVVSPPEGQVISSGMPLPLCVDFYTSTKTEVNLRCRLTGKDFDRTMVLHQENVLSWICPEAFEGLAVGDYTLEIFSGPTSILLRRKISVVEGKPVVSQVNEEWPGFLGGAEHWGVAATDVSPPLALSWAVSTKGMPGLGSPVVGHGKVIVPIRSFDFPGKNGVEAFDAASGKSQWFYSTDSAVNHSAVLFDELVVFQEMAGRVYALDIQTGKEIWRYDCGDVGFRWLYSAPIARDGDVFVGSAKWLACLKGKTGEEVWHQQNGGDWISTWSALATNGKVVTNALNWRKDEGKSAGVYAVDIASGELKWNAECIGSHGGVTFFDEKACFTDIRSGFHVIDAETGQQLWHKDLVEGGGKWKNFWSSTTPVVVAQTAVVGSAEGTLYALDLTKKKERWKFQAEDSILRCSAYQRDFRPLFSSPVISGGFIYIGSGDGNLYVIALETGEVVWKVDLGAPVLSTPAMANGMLFITSMDGILCAFSSLAK